MFDSSPRDEGNAHMNRLLRKGAVASAALMVLAGLPMMTTSAAAVTEWIPAPTWSQMNVDSAAGVFQQDLRMFDSSSVKMTDSSSQHGTAYIRKSTRTVTVRYDCTKQQGSLPLPSSTCAGKNLQFWIDLSGLDFTRVKVGVEGVLKSKPNVYVTKTADENGQATVTLNVTDRGTAAKGQVLMADDYIGVSVSACDRSVASNKCSNTSYVGPLALLYQDKGYYPQVKILNMDQTPALPNCGGVLWARDETWDWSVYKRSWFGDYACVYSKSYQVGDSATVPYRILDIWGTPMANYPVDFTHPSTPPNCGTVRCKWAKDTMHKYTDKNGYVTFVARNLNTAVEACANVGYNQDTKQTHNCAIGVGMEATTGMEPESRDLFWPQFVNSLTIPSDYIDFHVRSRGMLNTPTDPNDHSALPAPISNDVYAGDVKNPALPVAGSAAAPGDATFQASAITATLDLSYLMNGNPDVTCFRVLDAKHPQRVKKLSANCKEAVPLYAPDVVVTANNGGKVLRVCPDTNASGVCSAAQLPRSWDITSVAQMKSSQTFGWQYYSQLLLTATQPGKTTFTVTVGKNRPITIAQSYINTALTPTTIKRG
jgi:hypothetical protein